MTGIITSTQRMSIHDGPGIRTVVFLKGCNMRCKWCHNPETWERKRQLQYIRSKCIGCHTCVVVCPNQVFSTDGSSIIIDFPKCLACGTCTSNCCTGALSLVGREVEAGSLWDEVKTDLPFFRNSGGGITVSGGEPLLQKDFVREFLDISKRNGINTAIETNLSLDWSRIEELMPFVDLWMCDFKIFDEEKHKEWTGIGNARIKENIMELSSRDCNMLVRTSVIPGVNDNEEEISNISRFLSDNGIRHELLGFHTLGFNKYDSMGITNELEGSEPLSKDRMDSFNRLINTNDR